MTRHNLNVYFHHLKRQILQRRHMNLARLSWYDFLQGAPYKYDITHEFYNLSWKYSRPLTHELNSFQRAGRNSSSS
jgi:hypothetical protein